MCAVCKLHGVRFIKGIKIFESMFNQNLPSFLTKQLSVTFKLQLKLGPVFLLKLILLCLDKILETKNAG